MSTSSFNSNNEVSLKEKFKNLSHEQKLLTHRLCMNCLGGNHFVKQCKSNHQCKKCQKPHHTLLHVEVPSNQPLSIPAGDANPVNSHTATGIKTDTLMMTCRVVVASPDGSTVEARALLDSASERLAQSLRLPRSSHNATISGIVGLAHKSPVQSIASFSISAVKSATKKIGVTAVVVPRVTRTSRSISV